MRGRICILRHGYYPDDPRVFKEARALTEHGYEVHVLCLRRPGEARRECVNGVRVYRLSHRHKRGSMVRYFFEYGLSFLKMFFLLNWLGLRNRFQCVQVNTMPDALVFAAAFTRLLGSKVLLDMHEPMPELFTTKFGENRYPSVARLIALNEQLSIRFAHKVLTVNQAILERFVERGARADKLSVIRNVPDESLVREPRSNGVVEELVLINHGTINRHYGQDVLVRAMPILRERVPSLRLFIVGDGENAARIRAMARELDCEEIVTFTGMVPMADVGTFIQKAHIGIVPLLRTPFAELCQPNKIFEYILHQKPVIISRSRAIEESFDEDCVMFFEPGDHEELAHCVLSLHRDKDRRQSLVRNAYGRYQSMRWQEAKREYVGIYDGLLGLADAK